MRTSARATRWSRSRMSSRRVRRCRSGIAVRRCGSGPPGSGPSLPDARLHDPDRWPLAARIVLGQALQRQVRAIEFATTTFLGGCTAGPYVLTGGAADAHARPYQDLASAPDQDETAKLWRTPA